MNIINSTNQRPLRYLYTSVLIYRFWSGTCWRELLGFFRSLMNGKGQVLGSKDADKSSSLREQPSTTLDVESSPNPGTHKS
jgi:hypothetical protein